MSLRSALLTLAFAFAGALAFIFAALGTLVVLADRGSSPSGGATPATASHQADQVALQQRSRARGKGSAKDRAYFLKEIPRH